MNGPERYRQSLVSTFNSCPLRAKFSMEDPRRTPGPMAAIGTILHRFFHRATRIMWAEGEEGMSVEQGQELLNDEIFPQIGVPPEEVLPITMKDMQWGRVVATKWCEMVTLKPELILDVEERFDAPLELPGGEVVTLTGQMDLVSMDPPHGIVVEDYKTGWKKPKQPKNPMRAEEEGSGLTDVGWTQWLVYSYLLLKNFPSKKYVIFREYNVRWGMERWAKMEAWQMERLRDVLAAQVYLLNEAVKAGPNSPRWTPSAGTHCAMCARPRACPIMELEDLDLESEDGRRRVAQDWVVAGQVRDQRRAILDGLVDVYGPIEIPHSEGRRVVGWDLSKPQRRFGIFEPTDVPDQPYEELFPK